jgi:hypothetical protein
VTINGVICIELPSTVFHRDTSRVVALQGGKGTLALRSAYPHVHSSKQDNVGAVYSAHE